ncbi:MAG: LURP-one-related family protein, partial [Clostridia bacterium]|nr:LURP-one-related family protein [Clostridia bacterium]
MNLYLKQQVFSWGDRFFIYDIDGKEKYYVEGEVFSFGKKLHVYDIIGNEVAYIEQRLFTFFPKYTIYKGDEAVAEITKEFSFFKQEYTVDGPGWSVLGDFFDHEYEIS